MFDNYLKITLRNIRKHKIYSFINIAGLTVGMVACIAIYLYVQAELSYDRFHTKSERIYRVLTIDKALGVSNNLVGITIPPLAPALIEELPEIENAARILLQGRTPLLKDGVRYYSDNFAYTEPSFFEIFDFTLRDGDPHSALAQPNTAVLTEHMARSLFGDDSYLGNTFDLVDGTAVQVTGILDEVPEHSHLQFDVLVSVSQSDTASPLARAMQTWGLIAVPTYVVLDEEKTNIQLQELDEKMVALLRDNDVSENFLVTTQPLHEVHLHSNDILFDDHNLGKGDSGYVYSLSAIGVFILLIAAFNFMNLATARSANRAREVGMRKVVGAHKTQLVRQFLGESLLLCLLSFVAALLLIWLVGDYFNSSFNLVLDIPKLFTIPVFVVMLLLTAAVGLFSGSYPAFVLSSFMPTTVLKGTFTSSAQGVFLRRALVVLQFSISIGLIISSGIVYQQIKHIHTRNLGYSREQVVTLPLTFEMASNFTPFVERLSENPAILSYASSGSVPGRQLGRRGITPEGASEEDTWIVSVMSIDEFFLETLAITLAAGRNFSREYGTDQNEAIIINQATAKAIGWESALDKTIRMGGADRKVIGVIEDYHFATLRYQVEPLVLTFQPGANATVSLKITGENIPETLEYIEHTWNEFYPDFEYGYSFLDEEFEQLYRGEENFGKMAMAFTLLAIFIACLGLYGLASHTVRQRTKEIGIRKVLGSSIPTLTLHLTREFFALIALANLFAWPAAYLVMKRWLQGFAYRIDIGLGIFILAGIAALFIASMTISYQAIKAALTNPVDALRYE